MCAESQGTPSELYGIFQAWSLSRSDGRAGHRFWRALSPKDCEPQSVFHKCATARRTLALILLSARVSHLSDWTCRASAQVPLTHYQWHEKARPSAEFSIKPRTADRILSWASSDPMRRMLAVTFLPHFKNPGLADLCTTPLKTCM